jgi:hypothetical protein
MQLDSYLLKAVPLALAYLGPTLARIGGAPLGLQSPAWVNWAWAALAAAAAVVCAGRSSVVKAGLGKVLLATGGLAAVYLAIRFGVQPVLGASPAARVWLLEAELPAYVLFAVLWARTFGPPDSGSFAILGGGLGFLLLVELMQTSLAAGAVQRPLGPFGVRAEACLLLVSLCFAMDDLRSRRGALALTVLGLLATFSRPAILCAAVLMGLLAPATARRRAAAVLAMVGLMFLVGWLGRVPEAGLLRLDWYWTWAAGVESLIAHPWALLTGFPLSESVPLSFEPPRVLLSLWENLMPGREALPTLPFTFQPFWLRLVLCWGLGPLVLLLAGYPVLLGLRPTRPLAGLFVVLLVCGAVTGLLYDPVLGAAAGLAVWSAAAGGEVWPEPAKQAEAE